MCPMLPGHNFLVSGAEWPTEKHIKKMGPEFFRNLEKFDIFRIEIYIVSKQKIYNFPKIRKNSGQIFLYFFQLAILHHSPKN